MVEHAAEGNHGKAAILELGQLAAGEGIRVLGKTEGVKAEIARLAIAALKHLDDGDGAENLEKAEPDEELLHGALLDGGVMESSDLSVAEGPGHARELVHILDNETGRGEHANTTVLDLSLTKPAQVDEAGESERIEANIAYESSIQSSWALRLGDGVDCDTLQLALTVQLHNRPS